MERRDVLKGVGLAAGALTTVLASTDAKQAGAQEAEATQPPGRAVGNSVVDVKPIDPEYFIPGRFAGKTVIVTGPARGMGAAAALRLAREGANVVGVDWLKDLGQATHEAILAAGGKSVFVHGDIADPAVAQAAVDQAVANFGGLDAALNNAGVMDGVFSGDPVDFEKQRPLVFARIHEASDDYWNNVFRTNATGTFLCLRAELRQMIAQGRGGAIVNVGSIAGMTGLAGNPAYVASKHAVNGLTRNAAID